MVSFFTTTVVLKCVFVYLFCQIMVNPFVYIVTVLSSTSHVEGEEIISSQDSCSASMFRSPPPPRVNRSVVSFAVCHLFLSNKLGSSKAY